MKRILTGLFAATVCSSAFASSPRVAAGGRTLLRKSHGRLDFLPAFSVEGVEKGQHPYAEAESCASLRLPTSWWRCISFRRQ